MKVRHWRRETLREQQWRERAEGTLVKGRIKKKVVAGGIRGKNHWGEELEERSDDFERMLWRERLEYRLSEGAIGITVV